MLLIIYVLNSVCVKLSQSLFQKAFFFISQGPLLSSLTGLPSGGILTGFLFEGNFGRSSLTGLPLGGSLTGFLFEGNLGGNF